MTPNKGSSSEQPADKDREVKPLNCDRDAARWAREFNEVLAARGIQPLDPGWLISWFANAMMCGEDTYRWRKEAEARDAVPESGRMPFDEARIDKLTGDTYDQMTPEFRRKAYIEASRLARRFERDLAFSEECRRTLQAEVMRLAAPVSASGPTAKESLTVRPCTCHPDDNPPRPCPQKYALTECREAAARSTSGTSENADMWRLHARAFDAYLNELYAIMVDPCAEGSIKRDDLMQAIKNAALRDREKWGAIGKRRPTVAELEAILASEVPSATQERSE